MAVFGRYLTSVRTAIDDQKGSVLAELISLDGPRSGVAPALEAMRSRVDFMQLCERALEPPMDEVLPNCTNIPLKQLFELTRLYDMDVTRSCCKTFAEKCTYVSFSAMGLSFGSGISRF